jgi:hypothetical protein
MNYRSWGGGVQLVHFVAVPAWAEACPEVSFEAFLEPFHETVLVG